MKWYEKLLAKPMISKFVGSITRTGMGVLAGLLLGWGFPELAEYVKEVSPEVAAGLGTLIYLVIQGWSFKQKTSE